MMSTQYTIRPARRTDLDRLAEMFLSLQDHVEAANPSLWHMKAEARHNIKGQIASRLTADETRLLVAEHDGDGVVGLISGRIAANKSYVPERVGLVDQIFVLPGHRRAGVGSRLVAEICHFFAEQGVDDISLRYVVGNEAAAGFWTALGFSPRIVTAGVTRQVVEKRVTRGENL
jgi:GNAT superfamily N-acetyltransferase